MNIYQPMLNAKLYFSFILFLLFSFNSILAQTTSNKVNPNWNNAADWTGSAPGNSIGQTVTLAHNSTLSGFAFAVNVGGTLIVNDSVTLTTDDNITLNNGSAMTINGTIVGTNAAKELRVKLATVDINSSGTIDWAGFNNYTSAASSVNIDGFVNVSGNFTNNSTITGNGSIEVGGTLSNSRNIFGCTSSGSGCCTSPGCSLYNTSEFLSLAERSGTWLDNNMWYGGTAADTLNPGVPVYIHGYIKRYGTIEFSNAEVLTVKAYDTLWISQNLIMKNNATIVIDKGGLLIVEYNFEIKNGLNVSVDGTMIVGGEFEIKNDYDVDVAGSLYIYDQTPTYGTSGTLDTTGVYIEGATNNDLPTDLQDFVDLEVVDPNGPLPVEVLYFRSNVLDQKYIQLNWATAYEENFDYFTIERSTDGYNFDELDRISVKSKFSESLRTYAYVDEMPLSGYSFYRLKATDFDGYTEYHGILSIRMENVPGSIKIYPNPTNGNNVNINFSGNTNTQFKLVSFTGDIIQTGTITGGINEIRFNTELSPGIYFIQIEGSDDTIPQKLVIR